MPIWGSVLCLPWEGVASFYLADDNVEEVSWYKGHHHSSGQFLGRGPSGRILNNAFKLIERIMKAGIFEQTPKGMHLIGMSSLPRETAFILLELPKWLWWCGPIIQSIYISWHKHPVFLTIVTVHIWYSLTAISKEPQILTGDYCHISFKRLLPFLPLGWRRTIWNRLGYK